MTGRRIIILIEDSAPITLSVQRGFGDSFYAMMKAEGVTLAEMHDDGVSDCFDILAYQSVHQVEDACRSWQHRVNDDSMADANRTTVFH